MATPNANWNYIGTCGSTKFAQALRALLVGQQHALQRRVYPAALGGQARMGGKQGTGAKRFGEYQYIACTHTAFAQNLCRTTVVCGVVYQAVNGKAQRQFDTLARVAAYQRAVGSVEHLHLAL